MRDAREGSDVRACEGMREGEGGRGEGGDAARTHARASGWALRATRARDVHDDYSDIVVIVEGTIGRQ